MPQKWNTYSQKVLQSFGNFRAMGYTLKNLLIFKNSTWLDVGDKILLLANFIGQRKIRNEQYLIAHKSSDI
jgi:hypothetical protein